MAIEHDDPLGAMLGKGHSAALMLPDDDEEEGKKADTEHEAATALIDALHARDSGGVADAFKALYACCKPGADDEDMAPDSEEGAAPLDEGR